MRRSKYIIGVRGRAAADMTKDEKRELAQWVADGNSPYANPWWICTEHNRQFGFLEALRFIDDIATELGVYDDIDNEPWDTSEENLPF